MPSLIHSHLVPLAICLAMLSMTAQAAVSDAELLISTSEPTVRAAEKYNPRFMAEHRYFASRHRLAEINAAALKGSGALTIKLFEDEPAVTLALDSVREGPNVGTMVLEGSLDVPGLDAAKLRMTPGELDKLAQLGLTPAELLKRVTHVRLFVVFWDEDQESNTALLSYPPTDSGMVFDASKSGSLPKIEKRAFASVSGDIDLSVLGRGLYRIRPLKFSPRYHIVYQVDSGKTSGFTEEASRETASVDQRRRAEAYDTFVRSLPAESMKAVKGELK